MNIFVLGGQGFVGSAFVRGASQRHRVTALARGNYDRFRGRPCDLLINANGNSKKFLADEDPQGEFEASVASVLRSLLDFPAKRYVYLSTIDVYPRVDDPRRNRETAAIDAARLSRYGLHKHLAEQIVRSYAPRWLICRLGGMVGPGLSKNSIYDLLHDRPLRVDVESAYQFMHTDDVARIVFALLRRQPENDVFNVCGEGCMSIAEIARMAGKAAIAGAQAKPPRERYEVNLEKLKSLVRVPKTSQSLRLFLAGLQ